jgi:hypothetical protein
MRFTTTGSTLTVASLKDPSRRRDLVHPSHRTLSQRWRARPATGGTARSGTAVDCCAPRASQARYGFQRKKRVAMVMPAIVQMIRTAVSPMGKPWVAGS